MTETRVDQLYALPLSEFIAARNELAKELRAAGDRGEADRVKRLAKPSVAAWVVNQLHYAQRETLDDLLAAGAEQRKALARGTTSGAVADRKRRALSELLRHAETLLEGAGSQWTPTLRRRVHRTLEALAAQPAGTEVRPGRLSEDLQPAGFDALLGASIAPASVPTAAKAQAKPPSAAARRRREAVRRRLETIKADLASARRRKNAAAKKLAALERKAGSAGKSARAAERRAEAARSRANELDLAARKARSALDEAASEVARVEARLETESQKA